MEKHTNQLFLKIKQSDQKAFRELFTKYYRYMTTISWRIVQQKDVAQDMVQDAFVELWKRRKHLPVDLKVKSYLSQIVVNKSLNYIKREKRMVFEESLESYTITTTDTAQHQMELDNMQQLIITVVDSLPDRCRIIFSMSRFEGMAHKEIAAKLGISVKTVENQITIALKRIRQALKKHDYLVVLFFFFFDLVWGI